MLHARAARLLCADSLANHRYRLNAMVIAGLCLGGSIGASAQAGDDTETYENFETIVVTGSNIRTRRKDFRTPSPVQTAGEKQIRDTGALQIQDIFKGLTANSGSQIANRQNALQGLSQFSLRGLGIGSTLTLINGRRAGLAPVTDSSGQLFTDINQYPLNMIERVEVLTDGASSTYGSEAVAGVVNIYTRDDFEGFEITAEGRTATNESLSVGGAFGLQGSEGSLTLFANYYTQSGNVRSDFDFIEDGNSLADGVAGLFDSASGSPGRFNLAVPDAAIDGGFALSGTSVADPDCVAAGGILTSDNCRYHFLDQRRLIAEEDRIAVFAQADYQATDRLKVFSELSYSRNEIRDGVGGLLTRVATNDGGFLVPADHPFNFFVADGAGGITYAGPDAFAADPSLTAANLIYRGRILGSDADGANLTDIETIFTNLRFVGGFEYELGSGWLLTGDYVWANSDFSRAQPNDWDIGAFAAAIVAGNWNPFGTRVVNPDLISPKDGVSVAGNSEDVLSEIALLRRDEAQVTQKVAEMVLSGETGITLPGGPVAIAAGAQYRDLSLEDIPDARYQAGINRLNETIPPVFGSQDVYALFGEALLPVTDRLELQAALRFEEYGDQGGSTLDPKIAAKLDVTDSLSLRASWGTSFQAPSIRQVAGIVSTATINDPADPGGGAFIVTVVTQGSSELTPQSASNFNVGALLQSDWGLNLSLDFWHYDYSGLILPGADPQFIFDEVFAGNLPADRALRGPDGQPASVIANFENRGSAKASGFDLVARYRTTVGEGQLLFDLSGTLITDYTSSEFGDIKGNRNFSNGFGSTPDVKLNGGITYETGHHTFNVTTRYIGAYDDDQTAEEIASQTTVDARYQFFLEGLFGGEEATIGVGAVNIFDTDPPALLARPLFDNEVHDPRGRQVYVTFKQNF